jgi:MOSC domain-containing protein
MPSVELISVTPVKCFALDHPDSIALTEGGVPANRRFLLVDGENRRLRSSLTSWPMVIRARYDVAADRLWMRFPDGTELEEGALGTGAAVEVDMHVGTLAARVVDGEWSERLSAMAGHPVRLMRPDEHGHTQVAPVTLISDGSLDRLGQEAGGPVDGRRFRMLFTLSGCRPHEEDEWEGRHFRIGEAVIRVGGPVDRCAMTTRDPDTGETDLDTLRLIKGYRGLSERRTIDFGVYAEIVEPGRVRVGDTVEPQ